MKNLMSKLPLDIVQNIIPYTYNLQNKMLLDDIKNYKDTKDQVSKLYYKFWIDYIEHPVPEDRNWLINDIFSYANDYKPTMYGYVEKFYNILNRNIQLDNITKMDKYVELLEKKQVNTQINILWGLLLPNERRDIIVYFRR
jgi:hypothetical protein